jgi:segregation and condensation protein A
MEELVQKSYTVRTTSFEGPLELLLDLIEKRKLLVNEVSLASVTDDFILHIRSHAEFPMEMATDFIAVAATLLLIKSKSLLPQLELTEEEESDVEDLTRRLKAYEEARRASRILSSMFGKAILIERGDRAPEIIFAPSKDLSQTSLQSALRDALTALEKQVELPEARVRSIISLEEVMDTLTKRVQTAFTLSFKEFAGGAKEKVDVIVSFLALLELVKQGVVGAEQHERFEDITITNSKADVPRY